MALTPKKVSMHIKSLRSCPLPIHAVGHSIILPTSGHALIYRRFTQKEIDIIPDIIPTGILLVPFPFRLTITRALMSSRQPESIDFRIH